MKCGHYRIVVASLLVNLVVIQGGGLHAQDSTSAKSLVRSFAIAVWTQDEKAIRQMILPHPDASLLWEGSGRGSLRESREKTEARLNELPLYECQSGQTIEVDGGKLTISDEMANKSRKLFYFGDQDGRLSGPAVSLVLVSGGWKVDASQLIKRTKQNRAVMHLGRLSKAMLKYANDHYGELPNSLSDLTLPDDLEFPSDEYEIIAHGKTSDYDTPQSTVIIREKRPDTDGRYAAGYLDGHSDLRRADDNASQDNRVRAICEVCGAWTEGQWRKEKTNRDAKILAFTVQHLRHISANVRYVYPEDRRFELLGRCPQISYRSDLGDFGRI